MTRINGVHHLAISTADMKAQIEFFTGVLGAELRALYWMHGAEGVMHGFVRLHDHSYVAFVQSPAVGELSIDYGVTHAGTPGGTSAPGTLQHLAFNVDDAEQLLAMRDRIRRAGLQVMGPIEHGFCTSIYFAGPEGLTLEVSTSPAAIDGDAWIDPEVASAAGIGADDVARFVAPPAPSGAASPVSQPEFDPALPHMAFTGDRGAYLMGLSDEELGALLSETTPPVPAPAQPGASARS
jgi:catechol 2,3-dioxygenase-like lactoylglutathione lyase family enzyme